MAVVHFADSSSRRRLDKRTALHGALPHRPDAFLPQSFSFSAPTGRSHLVGRQRLAQAISRDVGPPSGGGHAINAVRQHRRASVVERDGEQQADGTVWDTSHTSDHSAPRAAAEKDRV